MSNYNEALDSEKKTLSLLVETSFYPQQAPTEALPSAMPNNENLSALMDAIQKNPELSQQIMQTLLSNTAHAIQRSQGTNSNR